MKLAPKLGQEHTMNHILPMLLTFLRDESAEVCRLDCDFSVFANLEQPLLASLTCVVYVPQGASTL